MKLAPHPRLYISADHYRRVRKPSDLPVLAAAERRVAALARKFLADPAIVVDETGHNYHLIRARRMQTRVVTLLTEYRRTGDRRCRDAILEDIRRVSEWEYWSWITWRQNDPRPEAIFDLSYGENSATLAIAFDGLREDLTDAEAALFVETARRRALIPYLHLNGGAQKQGYYDKPDTNWNTVCNGGAGLLALAMGDLCPESERVLALVEKGVAPFFRFLKGDGAWPEGTVLAGPGYDGFRMDVTEAMGTMRDGPVARFCGRAVLMVRRRGVLVIDRVEVSYAALVESRLHTFFRVTFGETAATIRGKKGRLHVSFAASQPARLKRGAGMPTSPGRESDTTLRHVSAGKVFDVTLCHFLTPNGTARVTLTEKGGRTTVGVTGDPKFRVGFGTSGLTF